MNSYPGQVAASEFLGEAETAVRAAWAEIAARRDALDNAYEHPLLDFAARSNKCLPAAASLNTRASSLSK